MQTSNVETYKRRFEELRCLLVLINPYVHEAYYVLCFVGGLRSDIQPLVQDAQPRTLMDACRKAKLHEKSFNALSKQLATTTKTFQKPAQYPAKIAPPITYPGNAPIIVNTRNLNPGMALE